MRLHLRREQIVYFALPIISAIIVNVYSSHSVEDLMFMINIALLVAIIAIAQFSLFTLISFISNYMLINVYTVYRTGVGYGLLAMSSKIYMHEMNISLLVFNASILLWILFSNILKIEKRMLEKDIGLTKNQCVLYSFLTLTMAYIAFPGFQFGLTENRFQALLPGHFWNHFMVVFLILASQQVKKSGFIKFTIALTTIWVLLHGERVDIVGFYAYLFIRYCAKKGYRVNGKFFMRFGVLLLLAFSILVFVGERRVGSTSLGGIGFVVGSLLSQGTASDVGYVFNSAIEYVEHYSLLFGKTYITYVQGIIPFFDQPYRAGAIIENLYHTAGGEFFLTEPLINFGIPGIFVVVNLVILFMKLIFQKLTNYKCLVFFFLLATAFRYVWYGLTYIETGLLYLLPLAWILRMVKYSTHSRRTVNDRKNT